MIRLYNQNIWGNMPKDACIANRNRLILSLIEQNDPDFCSFQECNPNTSRTGDDAIQQLLSPVYAEASAENAHRNFTPVFYKKDKWCLIDSGFIPYEGLNDKGSKSITWALLEDKECGKRVCVVSTHFWWKTQAEDNLQRLQNVADLTAVCEQIVEKYNVPIILSGDLNNGDNAPQGKEPYYLMKSKGYVDIRDSAALSTDSYTCHCAPRRNEQGEYVEGDLPTYTLDYIFSFGAPIRAERFEVLTSQAALASSDHCPLIGDFDL